MFKIIAYEPSGGQIVVIENKHFYNALFLDKKQWGSSQ